MPGNLIDLFIQNAFAKGKVGLDDVWDVYVVDYQFDENDRGDNHFEAHGLHPLHFQALGSGGGNELIIDAAEISK